MNDAHNIMDSHTVDDPTHTDSDGKKRPKFLFKDIPAPKERGKTVCNTIPVSYAAAALTTTTRTIPIAYERRSGIL